MITMAAWSRGPWLEMASLPVAATLILAMVALLAVADARAAQDVAANRECATCHVMWLTDFKRPDVTPLVAYEPKPLVATGRQDVASTERMCFSCHDGFVLDSRPVWRSARHGHPVGVKPTAKVKIPTSGGKVIFPLNDDGKVYCGTCHTAHGVDWAQSESPVFLRVKNVDSSLCLACHLEKSAGPEEGSHPVFRPIDKPPVSLASAGGKFGSGGSVICQSCHRVHAAPEEKMLVMDNSRSALCGTCHTGKQDILQTKHDLSIMAPEAVNIHNQTATQSGPCGVCHLPHNANGPALWARDVFPGVDPMSARCLTCHNPEGLAKKKTIGEHSHPVNVAIADIGIRVSSQGWNSRFPLLNPNKPLTPLPLYDNRGLRTRDAGKVGCASCHDPHTWSPTPAGQATAKTDPRKIEGSGANSFLRLPLDANSTLCTNCHTDKAALALSKHNLAITTPVTKGKVKGKKPVRTTAADSELGLCSTCHQPHNAKGRFLWARDTGPGKGSTVGLCTSCHRDGGLAEKKLVGTHSHPVGMKLLDGMKPNLPLFSATGGGDAARGVVECASCHDPHQWDPTNIASRAGADAGAEGDAATSFLRVSAAGPSDLCVECHREQKFVRRTDHDLAVTAAKAVNAMGETVAESGVCGQCHLVHNAVQDQHLWARKPGAAPSGSEQLCRSCHVQDGIAQAKIPLESQHPAKVQVWSHALRARFRQNAGADIPVYGADGKQVSVGVITCASCHNPHRWRPDKAEEGPGKNTEGDVLSSFLRAASSEYIVCSDCHGEDALYRYKYFHGRSSHRDYPLYR